VTGAWIAPAESLPSPAGHWRWVPPNMSAVLVDLMKQSTQGLPLDGAQVNQKRSLMQTFEIGAA
jgi:hypothetical protein